MADKPVSFTYSRFFDPLNNPFQSQSVNYTGSTTGLTGINQAARNAAGIGTNATLSQTGDTNGVTYTVTATTLFGTLGSGGADGTTPIANGISFTGSLQNANAFLAKMTIEQPTFEARVRTAGTAAGETALAAAHPNAAPGSIYPYYDRLTVTVTDSLGGSATNTRDISVAAPLVATVPDAMVTGVNWETPLSGFSLAQQGAVGDDTVRLYIHTSLNGGRLSMRKDSHVSQPTNHELVFEGPLSVVQSLLTSLTYTGLSRTGVDTVVFEYGANGINSLSNDGGIAAVTIATLSQMPTADMVMNSKQAGKHYFINPANNTATGPFKYDAFIESPTINLPFLPRSYTTGLGPSDDFFFGEYMAGLKVVSTLEQASFSLKLGQTGLIGGYTLAYGLNIGAAPVTTVKAGDVFTLDTSNYRLASLGASGFIVDAPQLYSTYFQIPFTVRTKLNTEAGVRVKLFGANVVDLTRNMLNWDLTLNAAPKVSILHQPNNAASLPAGVIPRLFDQNLCAHSRMPMDMTRHGWASSLFHVSQQ